MTITNRTGIFAICLAAVFAAAACGEIDPSDGPGSSGAIPGDGIEAQSNALMNTGGGTTGGKCTVTDGPHTGMGGTYDSDGWCCAGNVCVECAAGASGKPRCKDAVKLGGATWPGGGVIINANSTALVR
jgi:hypothetical protein